MGYTTRCVEKDSVHHLSLLSFKLQDLSQHQLLFAGRQAADGTPGTNTNGLLDVGVIDEHRSISHVKPAWIYLSGTLSLYLQVSVSPVGLHATHMPML